MSVRLRRAAHLVVGFARDVWPARIPIEDEQIAHAVLTAPERRAWELLAPCDRREAIRALRRLGRRIGPKVDDEVAAALLLHDLGKSRSGLGPIGRSVATSVGAVVDPATLRRWARSHGWRRRVALYCEHGPVGEQMLLELGARPTVAAWAGVHHTPRRWDSLEWSHGVAAALAWADGELVESH